MSFVALQEDLGELEVDELNSVELSELLSMNAKKIQASEDEIKRIERKIQQFGPGALPDKDFQVFSRPDGTSNTEEVGIKLQKEIERYTNMLKETSQLTGVTILNVNRHVLELGENHCKKKFDLKLLLLDRNVELTLIMDEDLNTIEKSDLSHISDKCDLGGKVTWFEIKFEADINKAIGAEIASAAGGLSVYCVLSLLKSFLQWETERDQLLKHWTTLYPDNVTQLLDSEGNKYLKIVNSKPDRPEFVLEWGRRTVNTRVEPAIKVKVIALSLLQEMDSENILQTIPEMFASMAAALGLNKALERLIHLVITDGRGLHPEQQGLA